MTKVIRERLHSGRPLIMGVLNVTPDSFSDGGQFLQPETALKRALQMVREGSEIIDIGGESTRPGAERIPADEQMRRTIPVIELLRKQLPPDIAISIDTTESLVAAAALEAGAFMVNDVSAGRDDAMMLPLIAERGAPIVLMHMLGQPATMQLDPQYDDVAVEVETFLAERIEVAMDAGVSPDNLLLDPGIGFGKKLEHNIALLASLEHLVACGHPVLLGTSRKSMLAALCEQSDRQRLAGATAATTALGVMAGVRIFRVHDVEENRQALEIAWAIRQRIQHGAEQMEEWERCEMMSALSA